MTSLPTILVVDDLLGRSASLRNPDRARFCAEFLLEDVTGDEDETLPGLRIRRPIARAVFVRGQKPVRSSVGDVVENDLDAVVSEARRGWSESLGDRPRWAMALVDLRFLTGAVTPESDERSHGVARGRAEDDFPGSYFGLRILGALRNLAPELPIVVLSDRPRDEVSREFARGGALGFLPRGTEAGPGLLRDLLWRHGLIPDEAEEIIGASVPLLVALRAARRASESRRSVLILGERGSGKELFACYLHRKSPGGDSRPLEIVNSGSLTASLFGSELFGHERGAFTSADRRHVGRVVKANGGDVFLDEIGNMPADVQAGLLRVLQDGRVRPLGGEQDLQVDVRFLSATNADLDVLCTGGTFRPDLLDRLQEGGTIHVPTLRERRADIPALVQHFLHLALAQMPSAHARHVDEETYVVLQHRNWPGNVRQLRSVVHAAVRDHQDVDHLLPQHFAETTSPDRTREQTPKSTVTAEQAATSVFTGSHALSDLPLESLRGILPLLEAQYAEQVATVLSRVLMAFRRVSPGRPDGEILIQPAMRLLLGNPKLTAAQAADALKRIVRRSEDGPEGPAFAKPGIGEALARALSLRPRTGTKRT